MKVKTYGVPGLTEWHGKLRAGSIEVQVSFTGGTASPSGAQPAYLTTRDPITQFVIENSKEFRNGFITLMMQQEIPGEHPRMAVPKPNVPDNGGEAPVHETVEAPVQPTAEETAPTAPAVEVVAQEPATTDASAEEAHEEDDGVTVIEVADKAEAVEYLKEHFNPSYTATQLRTKAAFEAACAEHKVKFVFTT